MTWSEKLVLSSISADSIFHHEQNGTWTNKFHIQNKLQYTWVVCFCWLLFWNTVVICTSGLVSKWRFGQSWDGYEWLHSSVVLNKGVCCKFYFILVSLKTCEAHNLHPYTFLFKNLNHHFARIQPPPPIHVGACLVQSTLSKNYLKWQEVWQLDSCTVDGLEGKESV